MNTDDDVCSHVYDGRLHHPFTCVVAGPSGSGKSTFVRNLILSQGQFIDQFFDYITIILGTEASVNPTLSTLKGKLAADVKVLVLKSKYPSPKLLKEKFPEDLKEHLEARSEQSKRGCIIFDDVMSELSDCGLLVELFTKYSSHYNLSVIYTTQNLFSKSGGKHGTDHVTIYRNTHMLVIFKNPMDQSVLRTLAHRLEMAGNSGLLLTMLSYILEHHRYIAIFGKQDRPPSLRYATDLFEYKPVPHQKVFTLQT